MIFKFLSTVEPFFPMNTHTEKICKTEQSTTVDDARGRVCPICLIASSHLVEASKQLLGTPGEPQATY